MKNNKNELDLTYQLNGNWVCHTMPYPDDDSLNTVTCTSWLPWDFRDWEYPSLYRFEKQQSYPWYAWTKIGGAMKWDYMGNVKLNTAEIIAPILAVGSVIFLSII